MADLKELFSRLDRIYAACPPMPCQTCGECCTSPHLSFVEFLRLLDWMLRELPKQKLCALVARKPAVSRRLAGHLECPLLEERRCQAHPGRGLVCRLIGIPRLSEVYGLSEPLCKHIREGDMTAPCGVDEIERALDETGQLNTELYPYLSEPYFLDSLNLECWFAVALDPGITQPLFLDLRGIISSLCDLEFLKPHYVNHTRLREKLDLIDRFFVLNEEQKAAEALACMEQVRDHFPYTGAYYHSQSGTYISFLRGILAALNGRAPS